MDSCGSSKSRMGGQQLIENHQSTSTHMFGSSTMKDAYKLVDFAPPQPNSINDTDISSNGSAASSATSSTVGLLSNLLTAFFAMSSPDCAESQRLQREMFSAEEEEQQRQQQSVLLHQESERTKNTDNQSPELKDIDLPGIPDWRRQCTSTCDTIPQWRNAKDLRSPMWQKDSSGTPVIEPAISQQVLLVDEKECCCAGEDEERQLKSLSRVTTTVGSNAPPNFGLDSSVEGSSISPTAAAPTSLSYGAAADATYTKKRVDDASLIKLDEREVVRETGIKSNENRDNCISNATFFNPIAAGRISELSATRIVQSKAGTAAEFSNLIQNEEGGQETSWASAAVDRGDRSTNQSKLTAVRLAKQSSIDQSDKVNRLESDGGTEEGDGEKEVLLSSQRLTALLKRCNEISEMMNSLHRSEETGNHRFPTVDLSAAEMEVPLLPCGASDARHECHCGGVSCKRCLFLSVTSGCELKEEEILKIVCRFGEISIIDVLPPANRSALVSFMRETDALRAVKSLNKSNTSSNARLLVLPLADAINLLSQSSSGEDSSQAGLNDQVIAREGESDSLDEKGCHRPGRPGFLKSSDSLDTGFLTSSQNKSTMDFRDLIDSPCTNVNAAEVMAMQAAAAIGGSSSTSSNQQSHLWKQQIMSGPTSLPPYLIRDSPNSSNAVGWWKRVQSQTSESKCSCSNAAGEGLPPRLVDQQNARAINQPIISDEVYERLSLQASPQSASALTPTQSFLHDPMPLLLSSCSSPLFTNPSYGGRSSPQSPSCDFNFGNISPSDSKSDWQHPPPAQQAPTNNNFMRVPPRRPLDSELPIMDTPSQQQRLPRCDNLTTNSILEFVSSEPTSFLRTLSGSPTIHNDYNADGRAAAKGTTLSESWSAAAALLQLAAASNATSPFSDFFDRSPDIHQPLEGCETQSDLTMRTQNSSPSMIIEELCRAATNATVTARRPPLCVSDFIEDSPAQPKHLSPRANVRRFSAHHYYPKNKSPHAALLQAFPQFYGTSHSKYPTPLPLNVARGSSSKGVGSTPAQSCYGEVGPDPPQHILAPSSSPFSVVHDQDSVGNQRNETDFGSAEQCCSLYQSGTQQAGAGRDVPARCPLHPGQPRGICPLDDDFGVQGSNRSAPSFLPYSNDTTTRGSHLSRAGLTDISSMVSHDPSNTGSSSGIEFLEELSSAEPFRPSPAGPSNAIQPFNVLLGKQKHSPSLWSPSSNHPSHNGSPAAANTSGNVNFSPTMRHSYGQKIHASRSDSTANMAGVRCPPNVGSGDVVRKWTARYEIQIDPHEPFQVTRRIIGCKGINMKRVVSLTGSKLRLRGQGSGYLEGPGKKEADDPLHLCISSCDATQYALARKFVEALLKQIYAEYDIWRAKELGLPPENLKIKFKEILLPSKGGLTPSPQYSNNSDVNNDALTFQSQNSGHHHKMVSNNAANTRMAPRFLTSVHERY